MAMGLAKSRMNDEAKGVQVWAIAVNCVELLYQVHAGCAAKGELIRATQLNKTSLATRRGWSTMLTVTVTSLCC